MSKLENAIKKNAPLKYLLESDINTLSTLKKSLQAGDVRITCMGLYNHGKSSLLNMLVEDYEGKTFKVADVRETTQNKEVKHGNITFVDTPGLNAQKNDDKWVLDAVKESDINIFVHNVNSGEFTASEVDFFHAIKNHWGNSQTFIQHTVFVLSRIDEIQNDSDIKNTALKMQKQIQDIFEIDAHMIPVSAKDYQEGILEKEDEIIEESNFNMLKEHIEALSNKLRDSIYNTRKERFERFVDSLNQRLSDQLEKETLELSVLEKDEKLNSTSISRDLDLLSQTIDLIQKEGQEEQVNIFEVPISEVKHLLYEIYINQGKCFDYGIRSHRNFIKLGKKLRARGAYSSHTKIIYDKVDYELVLPL